MKELIEIQSKLNAPKNQRNNFGKYNYRNCEDILEALKPLLKEQKCYVTINDDIVEIGDRMFVKAIATISSDKNNVSTTAFAELPTDRKGMDLAQVTGASSSYARKYALNGLFAIDDNKDADSQKAPEQKQVSKPKPKAKQTPKEDLTESTIEGIEKVTRERLKGVELNEEWVNWLKGIMPKFKEASTVQQAKDIQAYIYKSLKL